MTDGTKISRVAKGEYTVLRGNPQDGWQEVGYIFDTGRTGDEAEWRWALCLDSLKTGHPSFADAMHAAVRS
jgi:hypothetical protein